MPVVGVDTNRQMSLREGKTLLSFKGQGGARGEGNAGGKQLALECHVNVLPNEADTWLEAVLN